MGENWSVMMRKMAAGVRVVGVVLGCAACCGSAGAQDVVSVYGYDFALVGDPGNRDTTDEEAPGIFGEGGYRYGGVDYEYRISRTEMTVGQHLEFVRAYWPFYVKNTGHIIGFTYFVGRGIRAFNGEIDILPGHSPDEPSEMNWEYAARYVNWLHHGKVVEDWAFETGVYDTSTFVQDDGGVWQHQVAHSPGARFWLPTRDEWIKAGHWDPAKNDGAGGYWRFPNGSDVEPVPGLPGAGGERNAGDVDVFPVSVGSYPDVQSPWGLLDMAGGQSELLETISTNGNRGRRAIEGSYYSDDTYGHENSPDILENWSHVTAGGSVGGLRVGAPSLMHSADFNADGVVDYFDVSRFIRMFIMGDVLVDFRLDGRLDADDVRVFIGLVVS